MMISVIVNLKDKRLILDLATYIAEYLPALPVLKHDRIVLDELAHIDMEDVCSSVRSFMSMKGFTYYMEVDHSRREIILYIKDSNNITERRDAIYQYRDLFICPHCNYTTEYADILSIHIRVHYI